MEQSNNKSILPLDDSSRISRDSGAFIQPMLLSERQGGRTGDRQEWQRILFFVAGGAISLLFLLVMARQINPPDSALVNTDMMSILGHWDGTWTGKESRYTLNGQLLSSYEATRVFSSTSPNMQTQSVNRVVDNEELNEVWINRLDQDGHLGTRLSESGAIVRTFEGRVVGNEVFWSRTASDSTETIRCRIVDGSLHIDHFTMKANGDGLLISGIYKREGLEKAK